MDMAFRKGNKTYIATEMNKFYIAKEIGITSDIYNNGNEKIIGGQKHEKNDGLQWQER